MVATIPKSDREFEIDHLSTTLNLNIGNGPLIDEVIDTKDWYRQDFLQATFGDVLLFLGKSLGSIGEFAFGFYIYRLLSKKKFEVKTRRTGIGTQIRAGKSIPFIAIVYLPFVRECLDYELEAYVKKVGGRIIYVGNSLELAKVTESLVQEYLGGAR
ncbi:MAG: hypothetical protein ACP5E4_00935 [Candidatus Aenigmatarchaeota archaeon]